jgi:hypothetical protein
MKTGRPINFTFREKVMPFNAVTEPLETAVNLLPASANVFPGSALRKLTGRFSS